MTATGDTQGRKPRILLLMQFYDPEPVYKGQAFAEAVARAGYDVEVITGFPNYPGGKVYEGYRIRPIQTSEVNGVRITRLALYPSHDGNKAGRVLNYMSFAFSVFVYLTFFARRADLVYAYSPPPTVGMAAAVARLVRRFPVILDIHDLWPDTLPATGMVSNAKVLALVDRTSTWLYRRVQHVILHTEGFRERLMERGVPAAKTTAIIGWTDERHAPHHPSRTPDALRALRGLKVLYAGNIGAAQALDTVLEAALLLQQAGQAAEATFCFLGAGVSREALIARAEAMGLTNVTFLPRVAQAEVGAYLAAADALLVHLRDDPLFAVTIPSKVQAYMLAGRPILLAVRGEAASLIDTARCGLTVPPEDPHALADAVRLLGSMTPGARAELGANARAYYSQHLSMHRGMARFVALFERVRRH